MATLAHLYRIIIPGFAPPNALKQVRDNASLSSDSSLVVVNVVGNRVLLEYANGTITTIDVNKWSLLKPETAACQDALRA